MRQLVIGLLPGLHNLFVPLFIGNQTPLIVPGDLVHRILGPGNQLRLLRRHGHIRNGYGHGRTGRIFIAHGLDGIQHFRSPGRAMRIDDFFQNLFQLFLGHQEVHLRKQFIARHGPVYISQILGQDLIEQEPSQRGADVSRNGLSVCIGSLAAHGNPGLQGNIAILICQNRFVYIFIEGAFAPGSRTFLSQIINTQNHILRGNRHRAAV